MIIYVSSCMTFFSWLYDRLLKMNMPQADFLIIILFLLL